MRAAWHFLGRIGMDGGSSVDFTCQMPFRFTGKIEKAEIELRPAAQAQSKAAQLEAWCVYCDRGSGAPAA